jgi:hypothetical protein
VNSVVGSECPKCGADIVAPEWSGHVSAHCLRNVWSCEVCGYQFEDTVHLCSRELAAAARSLEANFPASSRRWRDPARGNKHWRRQIEAVFRAHFGDDRKILPASDQTDDS